MKFQPLYLISLLFLQLLGFEKFLVMTFIFNIILNELIKKNKVLPKKLHPLLIYIKVL